MSNTNRTLNAAIDNALRAIAETQRVSAEALEILASSVREIVESPSDDQPVEAREGPRLLTVRQAAERLEMSKSHVYRAVETGALAKVKIGSSVRISEEDLERYIEERRLQASVRGLGATLAK